MLLLHYLLVVPDAALAFSNSRPLGNDDAGPGGQTEIAVLDMWTMHCTELLLCVVDLLHGWDLAAGDAEP